MSKMSDHEAAILTSIQFLNSEEGIRAVEVNPYWPKWNAYWWHLSVLFEMGAVNRIPKAAAQKMLFELKRTHLPFFLPEEAPADMQAHQGPPCPCSLGNIYQVLCATGLDVDAEMPWIRSWFLKYQLPDGGLNCDEDAYHSEERPSSIVGTISPLEAILLTKKDLTDAEKKFVDLGAKNLMERELRLGSHTKHNADEREDEEDWLKPCFPRFYFYDVLRGLSFLLKWADLRNQKLPRSAIAQVVNHLKSREVNGELKVERHSYEGVRTPNPLPDGKLDWKNRITASHFPLMDVTSQIGDGSPYLTKQWNEAKELLKTLEARGLIA